ncbi:cobyrinate a,c-diamide synthase, partial [Peribacillus sp. NPDC060186]
MSDRRLVIAGTGSGVGKTTLTIGIMAALKKKGYIVQGFKCGPDYIDPTYHTAVTGRTSRNLDSWMFEHDIVREILNKASVGADISIIEGVMGFFDGKSPLSNTGSTAEISMITESPVLLIVNCASMARSAAAIVKGFQAFSTGPNIIGVIANQVGSEGHYKIVKAAIEQECDVPVMGYMKRELDIDIPSRHLG